MKTSQPEYHLKKGLFGKVCDFLCLKTHARLQLLTQLYLPHQRDSYHNCRADWILTYPQPQVVCVSKNGSHFNPTLEQDQACTITHQTESCPLVAENSCFKINYFWSTGAPKFKIGKPSTPIFLTHSKNKIMPPFGPDPFYQAKETKDGVFLWWLYYISSNLTKSDSLD
jgi:hypothetical protein